MHQFLTQALGSCSPCTTDQIIGYGKIEFMGCSKTCVPCKDKLDGRAETILAERDAKLAGAREARKAKRRAS